jgi:inhibitor of cysteine peptidase
MSTKFTLTLLSVILLVSLAGCSTTSPSSQNPTQSSGVITDTTATDNYQMLPIISGKVANMKLDASANGTTQTLKKGEVMSISLESNPSTGYSWFASVSNTAILAQMGEPEFTQPTESATPVVGAPGTQTYYFQAADTGSTTLTLEYKRGWETNVEPAQTITITVEVQ